LEDWIRIFDLGRPAAGLAAIAVAAALEYLFPPVPGDTVILLGFFLAGRGHLPWAGVVAAALLGGLVGVEAAYRIGSRLGRSYFFLRRSRIAAAKLPRLERYLARYGGRLLLVNRFLPVLRGLFLYAAGTARLPWASTFLCANASNLAWVLLLAWVGHRFGASWERLEGVFKAYSSILGVLFLSYLVLTIWRYSLRARMNESS
jgi:membrane protein DedA with SNARE-associated domain